MLQLRLLGGFALDGPTGPVSGRAAQPRQLAILAPLAANPSGVTRDKLAAYFWAEKKQDTARHLLADVIYVLRKGLGDELILSVGEALRLNRELVSVDVDAFQRALERNDPERAVELYDGPFLDGFFLPEAKGFEHWVESQRRHHGRLYGEALEALAERAEAAGELQEAAYLWERRATHDPLDSRAAARLIRVLAGAGSPGKALAHAQEHRLRLSEELQLPLPEEIRTLVTELRSDGYGTRGKADVTKAELADSVAGSDVAAASSVRSPVAAEEKSPPRDGEADGSLWTAFARLVRNGKVMAVAAATTALAAALGHAIIGAGSAPDPVTLAASKIAVVPPGPVVEDTALRRLGRELAVTLSAGLDGVGTIRTVPALTVLAQAGDSTHGPESAVELARRLGATGVLHGSLVRMGDRVQANLVLYDTRDLEPLTRAAVIAPQREIRALTDSAALAILRGIWRNSDTPTPSLASLTTSSLPALRAYLAGERAIAGGAFEAAARAFERAYEMDSTFAYAYWRSLYARACRGTKPDSASLARVLARREAFPTRDRLLIETYLATTNGERLQAFRRVTAAQPDYWTAWWEYANDLRDRFPYLGTDYTDIRAALERVVELHPSFAPGWQELFKVATLQRDGAAARRAHRRLQRLPLEDPSQFEHVRILAHLMENGGDADPGRAGELAAFLVGPMEPVAPRYFALGFLRFGFPRAQIQIGDAVLARGPTPEMAAAVWKSNAAAWATRGAWDEALGAADRWVRISTEPEAPLRAYGLATLGAWLEAVSPEAAARRRPTAVPATVMGGAAELAWLDGLLALARGDEAGVEGAREALRSAEFEHADLLGPSLDALHRAASGDPITARELAALEWARAVDAPDAVSVTHPFFTAVHRLAAARRLLAVGDTAQAARLLTWHEARLKDPHLYAELANRIVEPLALLERARIEEARGLPHRARRFYAGFLDRQDVPGRSHSPLIREATAALERLSLEKGQFAGTRR